MGEVDSIIIKLSSLRNSEILSTAPKTFEVSGW